MIVIKIENLWKQYRLGVIGHGTLTHDLQSWWAKARGKEDPNEKFGRLPNGHQNQLNGNRFYALQDINLEVKEGDVLGIIGKNGAGKSTLLKILSRVTAPTKGNIKIKGRIASLLEVGTGFHQELTGRENVFLNGAILGMTKQEVKKKFDEIVNFSGIESFIDTPVKRYSSGMYVRLAFAVAAHLEPEILIIDEVLAVGDAAFQKQCLGKMKDISNEGRAILFVSHNMAAISSLCTRGVLLGNGGVIEDGQVSDVVLSYYDRIASDEKRPQNSAGDEFCCFVDASLADNRGERVREIKLNEELRILMTYEILQQTTNCCVPNFHLHTAGGEYVCCLNSPGIKPMGPGRYRAECIIPPFLLNEGAYTVGVAVTSYHDCRDRYTVNFHESNMLTFNVVDTKIPDQWNYGFSKTYPGVIRPRLTWKIEEVN